MRQAAIICLMLLTSCGCYRRQSTQIPDVTKTNSMVLTPRGPKGSYLELHVHGHIKGSATLSGSWLRTQTISNTVDFKLNGDHYETNTVLVYSPTAVQGGTLSVDYKFR